MGNSGSRVPALLRKTHVPDFEWKIHDFLALVETKATSVISGPFDNSGYKWCLEVSPMHKKFGGGTPYVALNLMICGYPLKQASYNFDFYNVYSKKECLIPLQELLKSSTFLVDDSCVFGVEILKIDVSTPEKLMIAGLFEKKPTTVQNLFVQKKGFIKGTYTWTMNNFPESEFVRSTTFEVGGHKWYIGMYPRGHKCSTDCLSLFLCLDASNELPLESWSVAEMSLSIQDQKNGKHFTRTTGLLVFTKDWGWPDFIPLNKFKDPSGGYLVELNCVVKADFTIVGSSNDG
ncbi:hypothetical protein ACQ4PT_021775 [Festuca glaucescens]